jgi:hypothetical protein
MHARIYSLYWDNINPDIVVAQKAVFDHFQLNINQHRIHAINHGEWIDWVMTRMDDVDVFLFVDIDCIPLSKQKVMQNLARAAGGPLIGAEGAANHIAPERSYAGAWYVYINRKLWNALLRPSAKPSPYADVCQQWTDTWKSHNVPVELIPPTSCLQPKWNLPGRPGAYGVATTYGDDCFHLFEARCGNEKYYLERCRRIIDGGAVLSFGPQLR